MLSPNIKFKTLIKKNENVDFNKRTLIKNTPGLTSFYY